MSLGTPTQEVPLAHHRRFYSLALVCISVCSAAIFALGAAAARTLDAFVGLALSIASPSPVLALAGATSTPQVLGLHEARSFGARLMARSGPDLPAGRLAAVL